MTTIVLLPEPISRDDTEHGKDYYAEADLLAYGDERAKAAVEAERERIALLVGDDAWCISFQSIGQYRTALLKSIRSEPAGLEARRTAEHPAPAAASPGEAK